MVVRAMTFAFTSFVVTVNAFSTMHNEHYGHLSIRLKSLGKYPPSTTCVYNTHSGERHVESSESHPVQIIHQGHKTIINVREDEPILQALERQSTIADGGQMSSLALSNIPHECRRGNCLTCASKTPKSTTTTDNQIQNNNLVANVDNGLSPTIASELTNSGYVLTCCSYVTGPGVVLELDQNNEVWDAVYRQRLCDGDTKQVALEAQARLLRRVDEENVEKWKYKTEKVLSDEK